MISNNSNKIIRRTFENVNKSKNHFIEIYLLPKIKLVKNKKHKTFEFKKKFDLVVLETVRSEYEHVVKLKMQLEKEVEEYTNALNSMKGVTTSLIYQLKETTEKLSLEKVDSFEKQREFILFYFTKAKLEEDNQALREQVQQLKIDFENSESVQHDFVKLSQALQVIEKHRRDEWMNSLLLFFFP